MQEYNGLKIPNSFQEIIELVRQNFKLNIINPKKIENRRRFASPAKKFHTEAGTLTDGVKKTIDNLEEDCIFIMCAHQPNLMPYSGVVRKIVLMEAVKQKLEKSYSVPVITYYQFSDETFPDRWVKSAQLPDITSKDGYLNITNPEIKGTSCYRLTGYGKYSVKINYIQKPSPEILSMWKYKIRSWLRNSLKSSKRLATEVGYTEIREIIFKQEKKLIENTRKFVKILEESYEQAKNYADLNAFMLSKIVNHIWGYDTLFARYSECKQILKDEILSLLYNYQEYFNALKESKLKIRSAVITERLIPFWYHCKCGGLVNLIAQDENANFFDGRCVNCNKLYEFDILHINQDNFFSNISLRSIPFLLVYSNGLMPELYVGGTGGLNDYFPEAKMIADKLKIRLPIIAIWNPRDRYVGLGQLHAFLVSKRKQPQQVREKIFRIFDGKYSILDYAINIGLEETSRQWLRHLQENSDLSADVSMTSVFNGKFVKDFSDLAGNFKLDDEHV